MPPNTIVPTPSGHPTVDEILERNKAFEAQHEPMPLLPNLMASLSNTPSTFVITCMDPRCNPDDFLQPAQPGEYIALRNAGGRVGGIIPDLVGIDNLLKFKTVLVVTHTDCGMTYGSEEALRASLRSRMPQDRSAEVDSLHLPLYSETESENVVKNDVQLLRDSLFLREELRENVHGLIYDLATGKLTRVC